ncbi:putative RecA protein [Edwardsiella phage vB_EpM_ZHS]|jgi:protein RecA|nr:putative RecA protein [Edwardsiella phage vB_EpM_ZHS]
MAVATKKATAKAPVKKRQALEAENPRKRERVEVEDEDLPPSPPNYFASMDKAGLAFVSSGAQLIDCALGGGYALGRVVNIVGDRSAGKTLLAIEAITNICRLYKNAAARYAESESAFDENYAEALGLPIDRVEFNEGKPLRTIEDWYKDMDAFLDRNKDRPSIYVLDSLDALSDDAEMQRGIEETNTYGTQKAKKLGELFRKLVEKIERQECLLIVVSQLRDKIGVTFGETKTRSGGKALDYYASHILWLREKAKIKRTIRGVERIVGMDVEMRVKKNKVGLPFRSADYPVIFGYGIDDITAGVEWLLEVGLADVLQAELDMSKAGYKRRIESLRTKGGDEIREVRAILNKVLKREWSRIENDFLPKARKY